DIVKWLYENTESRRNDEGTMTAAVGSGKIELVEWLQEKFDQGSYEGVQEAVAKGHFEMVKWMYENESYDDEIGAGTLLKAAENGHLDIVKWIVENDEEYCAKDSGDNEDDGFVFGMVYPVTSLGGEASPSILLQLMDIQKSPSICTNILLDRTMRKKQNERSGVNIGH
ncbi:hypothetical protein PHMEG_00032171, partial [Phytophthora megakarya]